ncbi:MAG: hypothetical protein MZV63_52970 [Marinilabiliales bacterium]|nr:hypothetical protein [Marinilabiliales bacterium]
MFPKLLGDMVDLGTKGRMMEEITRTGLILMAILVAQALFGYTKDKAVCGSDGENPGFDQAAYLQSPYQAAHVILLGKKGG